VEFVLQILQREAFETHFSEVRQMPAAPAANFISHRLVCPAKLHLSTPERVKWVLNLQIILSQIKN